MTQPPWVNFALLLLVQLAVLLAALRLRRRQPAVLLRLLPPSFLIGIPVGVLFDLLIGARATVFHYALPPSLAFLLLNGAFSYGLALATAALFPRILFPWRGSGRGAAMLLAAAVAAAGLAGALFGEALLLRMIGLGVLVLAASELAALVFGRAGPLAELAFGHAAPFAALLAASAALGLAYEIGNAIFPVWRWTLSTHLPAALVEAMIVCGGYVVLFHPLATGWQLLQEKFGRPLA